MLDVQALSILTAALLDILFGDPRWMPHPIRWIGFLIYKGEPLFRKAFGTTQLSGILFTLTLVAGTFIFTVAILIAAFSLNFWLGAIINTLILYTTFASRDLDQQAKKVYSKIRKGNIDQARIHLSMIVGRDTTDLSEEEISRAAVETIAENTVDGVLSPIFYAAIGGAPLALAFKAASTLDSMVGHKNENYIQFGWASAKLDDLLNYVPARLSRFIFPVAAWLCKLNSLGCWKIAWRDGHKSPSPNAGISEAAFAGALNIQLGGDNVYQGEIESRPLLGDNEAPAITKNIPQAINMMYLSTAITITLVIMLRIILL